MPTGPDHVPDIGIFNDAVVCTLSGGQHGATGVERVRQILERRPTVVCGTPTDLLHLAEAARREGLDVRDAGVRMLAGGGEADFSIPATRDQLKQAWGADQV